MIPSAELLVQRALTREFIAADAVSVVLERALRIPNGSGGFTTTRQSIPAQVARLIPSGDGAAERTTADGKQVQPNYMLMGEFDFDLERHDRFMLDGREYEVVFINQNQQYEVKGEVYYLGD